MAVPPWQKGEVIRIESATANTRRFWIRFTDTPAFTFEPGQFVTLDLPIHDKPGKRWRSYSIASVPDNSAVIELIIVWLEGGAGTTYLFNHVTVGAELTLRGPQGVFTLPQSLDKDLYLICTGTGIAPFRSMLGYLQKHPRPHKNIYLIFGTRSRADLLYYEELMALQADLPDVYYLPTLSREQWDGYCGYVHTVYERLIEEAKEEGTLPPADFMLCGWKVMIDEARHRLAALGYDKTAIHLELYG